MSISLQLNRDDNTALYRQIAEHVKTRIGDGHLPAGTRLPTVRKLASELGVTRLTVQNAYGELQSGGWIEATVGARDLCQPERAAAVHRGQHGQRRAAHPRERDRRHSQRGARGGASAQWRVRHRTNSLLHAEEFWACFSEIQQDADGELFSYESTQGNPPLRIEIAEMLRDRHLDIMPDDVVVTNGLTQGLSMVTQALAPAGRHGLGRTADLSGPAQRAQGAAHSRRRHPARQLWPGHGRARTRRCRAAPALFLQRARLSKSHRHLHEQRASPAAARARRTLRLPYYRGRYLRPIVL